MESFVKTVSEMLPKQTIAIIILSIAFLIALLNITKTIILYRLKKKITSKRTCFFLNEQGTRCSHLSYQDQFAARKNNCTGCKGKTFAIDQDELETYARAQNIGIRALIAVAKTGSAILPYLSIIFTLMIAVFVKGNS